MTKSTLGEFFHRNSHLFTVLGVFGAISVYFTQLDLGSRWRRLGIVSSLTIFILIAIVIQKNIPPESSDKKPFDFVINVQRQRTGLVVFYVAFYAVVISVSAVVLQFSSTFIFLLQFLCFIIGIGVVRLVVGLVDGSEVDGITFGEDDEVVFYLLKIIRNSTYAFAVGGGAMAILWIRGLVPIQELIDFQIISPLTAIVIGIFSGLMIGGLLWIFLMMIGLFFHFQLRLLRGIGVFDESWNLNKQAFSQENED